MPKTVLTETKENDQEVEVVEKRSVKKQVMTDWDKLTDAGFIPWRVRCDGYKGDHPSDLSCHTNIIPTAENMLRHANPDHGGGWFRIRFRITDVEEKKSKVWKGLQDAGYVLKDFWCPHCRTQIDDVTPRVLIFHLQPHAGANRVNLDPQVLCMTIEPFGGRVSEDSDLNSDLRMQ